MIPYDYGTVSGADGIVRESLGSGFVYKTTKPFAVLNVYTEGSIQLQGTTTIKARYHTSKPTTSTVGTAGTELWSIGKSDQEVWGKYGLMKNIPAGTYFWFYPNKSGWLGIRKITLYGTTNPSLNDTYTVTHTVGSSDNVALGDLKYDVTNESLVTDVAGNVLATQTATTIANTVIDTTTPTISSVSVNETTLTVRMSEDVYAATVPDTGDFVITGGGTPTISNITGLPTAAGSADSSFTMTLSSALTGAATLAYTQNGTDSKRIKDLAGHSVASVSGTSIVSKSVTVSAVSGGYITDAEDENSLTISGSSTGLTTGTTVTVVVDGAGTDRTKTDTTDSSGNWSVSLTSDEVKALDASTPNAAGETITVTVSAPDAGTDTTSFVYDPVVPTATLTPGSTGGGQQGSTMYLSPGNKVFVTAVFNEGVSVAPTVQMKKATGVISALQ